jgi:hypothetical protein
MTGFAGTTPRDNGPRITKGGEPRLIAKNRKNTDKKSCKPDRSRTG